MAEKFELSIEAGDFLTVQRDLAVKLTSTNDIDEVLEVALSAMRRVAGLEYGAIYIRSEDEEIFVVACHSGFPSDYINGVGAIECGSSLFETILRNEPVYIIENCAQMTGFGSPNGCDLKSLCIIPIQRDDIAIGFVKLASKELRVMPDRFRSGLESIVDLLSHTMLRIQLISKIKESEELLRLVLHQMKDMVFVLDAKGKILYSNPSSKKVLGVESKELIGRSFKELIHEEDRDSLADSSSIRIEELNRCEGFRILNGEAGPKRVKISSRFLKSRGRVLGIAGILSDIENCSSDGISCV